MADILRTATSALSAFQSQIANISNNVANVATDGYTRTRVNVEALPGHSQSRLNVGSGVRATDIIRLADTLVFARQVNSNGEIGRLSVMNDYATRTDLLLTHADTGIAAQWSGLFKSMQDVMNDPASTITRTSFIASAEQLTSRWATLDSQLNEIDLDADRSIVATVQEANQLAEEVARLNFAIKGAGRNPSTALLDEREFKINKLAELTGGTIVNQADGSISLFSDAGAALVLGNKAMKLSVVTDPFFPARSKVALETPNGAIMIAPGGLGGKLGGLVDFRASIIDPAREELGRQAAVFAHHFNDLHSGGVDYNGNVGGDFFEIANPVVAEHPNNAGTAKFNTAVTDLSKFTGTPVELKYTAGVWHATDPQTGLPVPSTGTGTAADPLVINGMEISVASGTPVNGDSFLLKPTDGAATSLRTLISDPSLLAIASPFELKLASTNTGPVTLNEGKITDPALYAGFTGATITFLSPTSYSVDGGTPVNFTPGDEITGPGWAFTINGNPSTGDTFTLGKTGPRSADNQVARLLSKMDSSQLMDDGKISLSDSMANLTARVGSSAQLAQLKLDGETAINEQVTAQRESVSGVNLDEEAADLMKMQQAYQAATQLLQAFNSIFNDLMLAVRN